MKPEELLDVVNTVMPFGKYKGQKLFYLPEPYLVWMMAKALPQGVLGQQLALMYEIKLNGLESLFINDGGIIRLQKNISGNMLKQ